MHKVSTEVVNKEYNQDTSITGFKGTNHSSKEVVLKMMNELVSASHVTSKFPYPGITGVKFHALTLVRGVLRHQQPRLEPRML